MVKMRWDVNNTPALDIIDAEDKVTVCRRTIYVMELHNVITEMMKCFVVSFTGYPVISSEFTLILVISREALWCSNRRYPNWN